MIIVYCCYGGTHSSPVAAAIHLGMIKSIDNVSVEDIWSVKYFDRVETTARGKLNFVGEDEHGNQVFVCGRGSEKQGIEKAIISGVTLAGGDKEQLKFVDTLPAVNILMRIGGYMSRQLHWIRIGRPLVIKGTQKAIPNLARIVYNTKLELSLTSDTGRQKEENNL